MKLLILTVLLSFNAYSHYEGDNCTEIISIESVVSNLKDKSVDDCLEYLETIHFKKEQTKNILKYKCEVSL